MIKSQIEMKFIVSNSELLQQLTAVRAVLNKKNLPEIVRDNLGFQIKEGMLYITAWSMETEMTASLTVETNDAGCFVVPARLLFDTLKNIPDQPLPFTIRRVQNDIEIEISSDCGKYLLPGHNAEDFPVLTRIESSSSFEMNADVLLKAIEKCLFAVGNDELRPAMCGMYVAFEKKGVTFVATDAIRLVRVKCKDIKFKNESSFIMPTNLLILLKNNLTADGKIKIECNDVVASFAFNNMLLIHTLINKKYPRFDAVIPKKKINQAIVDREPLLHAVQRVSAFANKKTYGISLKLGGEELIVSTVGSDLSNDISEGLHCRYTGKDMEIGFNAEHLISILSNIDGEEVVFEMSEPNRGALILSKQNYNDLGDVVMLLMPIMLPTPAVP